MYLAGGFCSMKRTKLRIRGAAAPHREGCGPVSGRLRVLMRNAVREMAERAAAVPSLREYLWLAISTRLLGPGCILGLGDVCVTSVSGLRGKGGRIRRLRSAYICPNGNAPPLRFS